MKIVRHIPLEAPPDKALQVIGAEPFNMGRERRRPEVVETSYHVVEQSAGRLVFEIRTTEYRRTMTGGIDRGATCKSVTRSVVSDKDGTLSWIYEGGAAPVRMKMSGVYRVAPGPAGSDVTHEVTIEVKVPLIGEKIARLAGREFEKLTEGDEKLLQQLAREAAAG